MRSSTLSDDDASELLRNLLRWLTSLAPDTSSALSVQKLCHALVTYFVHFSHLWPRCVRHVLLCLDAGRSLPSEELEDAPDVSQLAARLDANHLRVAMWFVGSLVLDVGKTDMSSAK